MATKTTHNSGASLAKSDFFKMAVQLAMERALNAEAHTKWLGRKCRNDREKAAWADCLTLYEKTTVSNLNQTLDPTTKCTDFDTQTWLSAALTNLETCRAGILQAAVKADVVVAQDGSGDYRTVKAAVEAAGKRSGSGSGSGSYDAPPPVNWGIRIVPEKKKAYVIGRLGKYAKTLEPGINLLIPFVDNASHVHSLEEEDAVSVGDQSVIMKDNVSLLVDGVLYVKVGAGSSLARYKKSQRPYRPLLRYPALDRSSALPNEVAWWCDRTPNPEPCKHFMATKTTHNSALTNIETCRAGFVELNASDYMLPFLMNNNVTKLISNALANNNNSTNGFSEGFRGGFPSWFKAGDRRLLRAAIKADVVVAQDGSGDYRTVKAAVEAAGKRSGSGRFVIYVKKGIYRENVEIGNKMKNITMVGDGRKHMIITGSLSVGGGTSNTTFYSATVIVIGSGFIARGITFRNTAGPQNHQAVALLSTSDQSVFYRCGFEGYQDTLYVHSNSQFYKECYVYGTVDFIFGNAAVIFQNCMIYGRRPMASQKITITAQGRTKSNQNTGIVIQNSRIMAASDLKPVLGSFRTFLGRPWKKYSRTVYLKNYMDSLVDPPGWLEQDGKFALNTLYYGEYRNTEPGSSTSQRVKWRGYRVITSSNEASRFTVAYFIASQS
ncbi:hypothetical protein OSB04_026244 [Centaurea solstitialis]|uniref:Pectinesterase n=1 Tax=Centaurea solstitialis TaxID=347529 RepID=A0AA38SWL8_9ASTR|nr:hypothetical protein OSB04_026244 [Centaurea solstitialis]